MRDVRTKLSVRPTYKMVDTCAAEFEAFTPYFYSSYDAEDEEIDTEKQKVLILGSGSKEYEQKKCYFYLFYYLKIKHFNQKTSYIF